MLSRLSRSVSVFGNAMVEAFGASTLSESFVTELALSSVRP